MRSVLVLGGPDAAGNRRYLAAIAGRGLTALVIDMQAANWPAGVPVTALEPVRVTEIADRAVAWSAKHPVAGVCAPVPDYTDAAAVVADLLGLPSPGLRAAGACLHPDLRRQYLAAWSPAPGQSPAGTAYAVASVSVAGDLRRADVLPAAVTDSDRARLIGAHRAILDRLRFGTGMVRADYRQEPGREPVLTGLALRPPDRPAIEDSLVGLCLRTPAGGVSARRAAAVRVQRATGG